MTSYHINDSIEFSDEDLAELRSLVGQDKEFEKAYKKCERDYIEKARAFCLASNKLAGITFSTSMKDLRDKLKLLLDLKIVEKYSYLLYKFDNGVINRTFNEHKLVEAIRRDGQITPLVQFYKSLVQSDDMAELMGEVL